jgi:hypothetical protein
MLREMFMAWEDEGEGEGEVRSIDIADNADAIEEEVCAWVGVWVGEVGVGVGEGRASSQLNSAAMKTLASERKMSCVMSVVGS